MDQSWLEQKYTTERLSMAIIARLIDCSVPTVRSYLKKIRRNTKYIKWRTACYKRDDYTCQNCGKRGNGDLNVDHIKPFALIISENNIKTIEQLYACVELWNLSNGRTLCVQCHEQTPTFGYGTRKMLKTLSARKD